MPIPKEIWRIRPQTKYEISFEDLTFYVGSDSMSEYQIGEFIVTEKGQDAFVIELYKTETSDSASPRYSARWVSRVPLTGGTITRTDTILQNIELKCPDELIIDNLKVLALEPFRHHGYYYK